MTQKLLSPLQQWLAEAPEATAFVGKGTATTRRELLAASEAAAAHLHALGFRRGDTLALLVPDSIVWLQFLFAASRLGILLVPISTRYRDSEIRHALEVAQAKGIVYLRQFLKADFDASVRAIAPTLPHLGHVIALDGVEAFFPGAPAGAAALPPPAPEALLCTFNTSGTTGRPKFAVHTQASIVRHARKVARAIEIDRSSLTLCALPLYGVLGFVSAMATLAGGGACLSHPVFNAEEAARLIDAHGVTHFYGSDGMLDSVLRIPGRDFASLRRGGFAEFAGLGRRLIEFAEARFGLRLGGVYGSSECYALMALRDPALPLHQRAIPGGRPTSDETSFRVVDVATGMPLEPGQPGELQIRGPNVMAGYLNNPDATREAMTQDGWFRTGDLACAEGDGFVFLSRMKDSLRLRGYLVDPAEIEAILAEHRSVGAAQVVGVHRDGHGDVAVAFVRPREGSTSSEDELRSHCAGLIANYKVPSRIVFVDSFPVVAGPNGAKIQKNRLRDLAETLVD